MRPPLKKGKSVFHVRTLLLLAISAVLAVGFGASFDNEEKLRFALIGVSLVLLFTIATSTGLTSHNRVLITITLNLAVMVLVITTVPHPIPIFIALCASVLLGINATIKNNSK